MRSIPKFTIDNSFNESYDKLQEEYFRPWIASKRNQARSDCLWLGIIPIHLTRDEKTFEENLIDKGYTRTLLGITVPQSMPGVTTELPSFDSWHENKNVFSPMKEHKLRLIFKIRLLEIPANTFFNPIKNQL